MNGSANYTSDSSDARAPPPPPPPTIAHLSSMTQIPESDTRLPLKSLLRSADHYRMKAQQSEREGDIEGAFVAYGIAAKYALEMVPVHKDYGERLSREQRTALEKVSGLRLGVCGRPSNRDLLEWRAHPRAHKHAQGQHHCPPGRLQAQLWRPAAATGQSPLSPAGGRVNTAAGIAPAIAP